MKENENNVVKQHKLDNPLITNIDSIADKCYRHCHNSCVHNFNYECIYDIELTNTTNIEIINFTISAKSMNLFVINEK